MVHFLIVGHMLYAMYCQQHQPQNFCNRPQNACVWNSNVRTRRWVGLCIGTQVWDCIGAGVEHSQSDLFVSEAQSFLC